MVQREGSAQADRAHGYKRRCIDVAHVLVSESSQERFGGALPIFKDKDGVCDRARVYPGGRQLTGRHARELAGALDGLSVAQRVVEVGFTKGGGVLCAQVTARGLAVVVGRQERRRAAQRDEIGRGRRRRGG